MKFKMQNFELSFNGKANTIYNQSSLTRTFEYFNHYITEKRMSNGNKKLHNMLVFDLPSVKSCPNCKSCKSTCYATHQQIQYPDTNVYRNTNLHLFLNEQKTLQMLIEKQLTSSKKEVIRLHGAGDFFSQEYINFWANIIMRFPNKKFYAYTKVESMFDFSNITKLKNFNLITSFVGGKLNYGSLKYCEMLKERYNAFICPCGIDESKKCGVNCNYCITGKNVVFLIH